MFFSSFFNEIKTSFRMCKSLKNNKIRQHQNSLELYWIYFYRQQRSWGKVIFSQASMILSTGRGGLLPGGCPVRGNVCLVWGVPAPGGVCLLPGGACSGGWVLGAWPWGGAWWRPSRDGYCCGRYASYWNAFLLILCLSC